MSCCGVVKPNICNILGMQKWYKSNMARDKFLIQTNSFRHFFFCSLISKDLGCWFCVLKVLTVWGFYVTLEKPQTINRDIPVWFSKLLWKKSSSSKVFSFSLKMISRSQMSRTILNQYLLSTAGDLSSNYC